MADRRKFGYRTRLDASRTSNSAHLRLHESEGEGILRPPQGTGSSIGERGGGGADVGGGKRRRTPHYPRFPDAGFGPNDVRGGRRRPAGASDSRLRAGDAGREGPA